MDGSVLVDTDPAWGTWLRDVDDALAIVHLWAHDVPLAGLTTCFGNADLRRVTAVAHDLGRRIGVPVFRGASGPADTDTAAVERLTAHRGTVLALAPLTNIAAALQRGARWDRLVILGGTERRLPNLRPLHTTELNLAVDEPAARIALAACTDLIPMEICRTVWFGPAQLRAAPPWLAEPCRGWLWSSPLRTGRVAFHPWDWIAAAWLTHPQLFQTDRARPRLASRPGWRGSIVTPPGSATVVRSGDLPELSRLWHDTSRRLSRG